MSSESKLSVGGSTRCLWDTDENLKCSTLALSPGPEDARPGCLRTLSAAISGNNFANCVLVCLPLLAWDFLSWVRFIGMSLALLPA